MRLLSRARKSNGIVVSADVHRFIARGNAARDVARWDEARAAYREALDRAPDLAHIWVQLGHAESQLHRYDHAELAYARAAALSPDEADPLIHLGHMRKEAGDLEGGARYYLQAARRDPGQLEAVHELQRLMARIVPGKRKDMRALLATDLNGEAIVHDSVFVDVTDALTAVLLHRPLSAAERAEADRLIAILDQSTRVQPCAYVEGRPDWVALSTADARRAIALGCDGSMSSEARAREAAAQELAVIFAQPVVLAAGAQLITTRTREASPGHAYFLDQAEKAGVTRVAVSEEADLAATLDRVLRASVVPTPSVSAPVRSTVESGGAFGLGAGSRGLDFRHGLGWLTPQVWGSRTHGRGAELALPIETGDESIRFSILLRGLPSQDMDFRIAPAEGKPFVGTLRASEERWVAIVLPRPADGVLRVFVKGDQAAAVREQSQERSTLVSVGVVGFHLCAAGDQSARMALLEGITLGDIRWS